MPRPLTVLAVLLLAVLSAPPRAAAADDDEPNFDGKPLSFWLSMLEGNNEFGQRRLALHALGAGADHTLVWRQMTRRRQGALLVIAGPIGPTRSKKVLPALVAALRNDGESAIRASAAQSLGTISAKCKAVKQDFNPGRDALYAALRTDTSGAVREAAAMALGRIDPTDVLGVVPTLIERLKDDYAPVRAAAATALFRLGKDASEAAPALREAVEDEKNDGPTRFWAAQALGKIGAPDASAAVPALQKVLANDKTSIELRKGIIEILGKFGKDAVPAVPLLAKLLTEEGSPVELRGAAVAALEQLGPEAKAAVPALKKAAKDRDKFVRSMALSAFAKIGKELGPDVKDVVVLLREGTDDPLLEVRLAAIETLGNLGSELLGSDAPAVRERLRQLSESVEKDIREAAQNALKKLTE